MIKLVRCILAYGLLLEDIVKMLKTLKKVELYFVINYHIIDMFMFRAIKNKKLWYDCVGINNWRLS